MKRTNLWIFLFAALAAVPAFAEPVTVKVFSLPSKQARDPGYRIVARFQQLYPDIRLEAATALTIEGHAMDAAPLMAIAGGTSPDIIYVNFRQSNTYIRQGFLYPLDEYIAEMDPAELAERIPAPVRPVVHRVGPGGEHYWALPYRTVATVMRWSRARRGC